MGTMAKNSHTRQLVEVLFDGQLEPLVRKRRAQGKSWRRIAQEIDDRIHVDLSPETVRAWFSDSGEVSVDDQAQVG